MKIALTVIFIIASILLIILVLMQEGKEAGLGSLTGAADSGVFRCIPHASVPHPHHRFLMPPRLRTGWWTVHT